MPIYEFVCNECGYEFERIMSFSATTIPGCAHCGSENVSRRMGRPAIHFKGSGWYITDSKKSNKESANGTTGRGPKGEGAPSTDGEGAAKSAGETSAGETSASETKPAPKAAPKSDGSS